jgi:Flp pilus assembly protein TadD
MAQIIKLPAQAAKFDYKRVKGRRRIADNPNQLSLFPPTIAKILTLAPGQSVFEQALALDERGDARAEELYRQAIAEGDCVADAYCNLGILQSRQGNAAKAVDSFTTSLKHNPRHFEAHFNLGNLYFDVDNFRLAQIHFQIAAEIDPVFPNVYFNLALVQALNNDFAAAVVSVTTYQGLVSEEEGRHADELLRNLRKSLAAAKESRPTAG